MTLSQRISTIVDYSHLSVKALSEKLGFRSPQILYELIKGKTQTLSKKVQDSILNTFPEINRVWLLSGEGEMLVSPAPSQGGEPQSASDSFLMVPVVYSDSVGGLYSQNDILSTEYTERLIPMTGARPGDVAIYQSGNSMAPAIPSGALLLIREVEGWREYIGYGDVFVMLLQDERRITKEIRRYDENPKDYFWCVSYNPDVADEELPKSMVLRVWKVVKVLVDKGW